jgi:hypothetical protein
MSKTYVFISHVEHNHLLEVADILKVRSARGTQRPARSASVNAPARTPLAQPHAHTHSLRAPAAVTPHARRSALLSLMRRPWLITQTHAAQTHANPDVAFSGVMPLHLAVEEGFVDMAAYLLHWGATKDAVDGFRKTPLLHAQQRQRNKKTKDDPNNEVLIKCVRRDALCLKHSEAQSERSRAFALVSDAPTCAGC